MGAAPLVAELLRAASGVVALVTSRMVLRLSGEHEFPVPPLPVPPIGAGGDAADVQRCASVCACSCSGPKPLCGFRADQRERRGGR